MKNLIHSIPEKGLKEKQCRQFKETVILEYEDYIGCTEKYHSACCENELFRGIFIESRKKNKASWKDKKTHGNHPKNRRNKLKCHKSIESPQNSYKACEKERVFIISIVDPDPEAEKEKKRSWNNNPVIHISPKKGPKKISKYSPGNAQNTIRKVPRKHRDVLF